MNPVGLARTAVTTAVNTALHPVSTAAQAVGLVRGAAHAVSMAPGIVADTVSHRAENRVAQAPAADRAPEASPTAERVDPADSVPVVHDDHEPAPATPGVPDLEPPDPADRVRVVEEALAAEAAEESARE